MLRVLPALVTLCIAVSVLAADASRSPTVAQSSAPDASVPTFAGGFAYDVTRGLYEEIPRSEIPSRERLETIEIDGAAVVLEQTTMQTAARLIGAPLHHQGEAGESTYWACLSADDHTLWLYSDGEMGDGRVTAIGLERTQAEPVWGCGTAEELPSIAFPVPGIGTARSAIEAAFGAVPADHAAIGFRFEQPSRRGGGFFETAFVVYRFAEGLVDAVGIEQITGD